MLIQCDRCKKPVEKIVINYDHAKQGTFIQVSCHGEKDSMFLADIDSHDIPADSIGVAFQCTTGPKLLESKD